MVSSIFIGFVIFIALEVFWHVVLAFFLSSQILPSYALFSDSVFLSIVLPIMGYIIVYVSLWVFVIMPNLHRTKCELFSLGWFFGVVILAPSMLISFMVIKKMSLFYLIIHSIWGATNIAIVTVCTRHLLLKLNKI